MKLGVSNVVLRGRGGKLQIDAKIMINVQRLVAGIEALSGE